MILYASQRERYAELARHLMNGDENDHVTVHDIRGYVSDTVLGALREAYAVSRGTRCSKYLFSLSLNPPEFADVSVEDFEAAIEEIEKRLNLVAQPRVIVFHEKKGRRHCHVVWSRIQADKLVAVHMSHFKRKLMEVSRLLYLKHGWKMPKGMEKGQSRSPWHLTREEYRQAVRLSEDPQALKGMFKTAWERSDSKETFIRALEEFGLLLAKGDRRGYVAIDIKGGVYSLTRWVDIGTRDLKSRLGPPEGLPTIEQAKAYLASRMSENLNRFIAEAKSQAATKRTHIVQELRSLVVGQRQDRQALVKAQLDRWDVETRARSARLHSGIAGVWQKITGEYANVRLLNEAETKASLIRDRKELQTLVRAHLEERRELHKTVTFYREEHRKEVFRLRQEIARYVSTATEPAFLPPTASADGAAVAEKLPLAAQLAQVEAKIVLLSGDLSTLQASLEDNRLSDEIRARIRRMIEKTMEVLELKAIDKVEGEKKEREERKEIQVKQAELNEYVRRYAEIQVKIEAQAKQQEASRAFVEVVNNMSYSLNGVPRWPIFVMSPPPERQLDETVYVQTVVQNRDNAQLVDRVLNCPENESKVSKRPPIDPKMAVPNLRRNILEAKEMLMRAGIKPPTGGGVNTVAPVIVKLNTATSARASIKVNLNNLGRNRK